MDVLQFKYLQEAVGVENKCQEENVCRVGEPACILPHAALTRAPAPGQRPGHRFHTAENPLLARKQITLSLKFSRKTIPWKRNSSVWVIFFCFASEHGLGKGINFTSFLQGKTPISEDLEKILVLASVPLHDFVPQFLHLSASQP